MSYTVAVTGKGGVGKTTIASLLVTRLVARGCAPVLAVDADPNTCLDAALGLEVQKTIGAVREEELRVHHHEFLDTSRLPPGTERYTKAP